MNPEIVIPLLSALCANLVASFVLGYAVGRWLCKDPLKVFLWSALLTPLAGAVAILLLPDVEEPELREPKAKRRSKRKQAALDEAAAKMGLRQSARRSSGLGTRSGSGCR